MEWIRKIIEEPVVPFWKENKTLGGTRLSLIDVTVRAHRRIQNGTNDKYWVLVIKD